MFDIIKTFRFSLRKDFTAPERSLPINVPIIVAGWNARGDAVELAFYDPEEDLWSRLCQAKALHMAARKLAKAEARAFAAETRRVPV